MIHGHTATLNEFILWIHI